MIVDYNPINNSLFIENFLVSKLIDTQRGRKNGFIFR